MFGVDGLPLAHLLFLFALLLFGVTPDLILLRADVDVNFVTLLLSRFQLAVFDFNPIGHLLFESWSSLEFLAKKPLETLHMFGPSFIQLSLFGRLFLVDVLQSRQLLS